MAKFTKTYIDSLPLAASSKEQKIYWDDKLVGFGVVVGSRSKTFIVQRDVRGKARRRKIGRYSEALTVAKAKETADDWLGKLAKGIVPWEVEAAAQAQRITLKDAWDKFIASKKEGGKLSPKTIRNYEHSIGYLKDWYKKDMSEIDFDKVEEKHRQIGAYTTEACHLFHVKAATQTMAKLPPIGA